jgi:pimeloyl-ACP methyl ester carboxylesterase
MATPTSPEAAAAWPGRHVDLPGVRLWVHDSGGDGPPLVLLHANTGTSQAWWPQVGAFIAAGHRVIAFDRRGWGRSLARADGSPQPGSIAEDLDALTQVLDLTRIDLLGIAGGGFAAIDYAAWRPQRVHRLVVAASNGRFSEPEMEAFYARIAVPGLTGVIASRPYLEVGPAYRAEDPQGFARFIEMEHHAKQPDAPAQPLRTPNTFEKVRAIRAPTLVLSAGADLLAPPALMRTWARHLADVRFEDVPDAGHSLNWERPAAFNDAVLRFLGSRA